jgi:hypothetical protein
MAIPQTTFLVWRNRRLSYSDADARIDGFAHYLASVSPGRHIERDKLAGHELADYQLCRDAPAPGGLRVMDDSRLFIDFRAPGHRLCGYAVPSRVVKEYALPGPELMCAVGHYDVFREA